MSPILLHISLWIVPVLSVIIIPITIFIALGKDIPISLITSLILGILFILLGNYLPKNKQNYTIGIRFPWTLHNEENWNKTNRLGGYLLIIAGIMIIVLTFILNNTATLAVYYLALPIIAILLPAILSLYSFILYKKEQQEK